MADKTRVRVTIEPSVVREVDDAELLDLHRQGLLYSFERSETTDAVTDGAKSPHRWQAPAKGDDIIEAPASVTDTPTEA